MTEQRPNSKPGSDSEPQGEAPVATKDRGEDQPKVTRRMSVEEHLAGLWKVLGLGD